MFRAMLRPGQGFRRFTVLTRGAAITTTGRPTTATFEEAGEIIGIIVQASQREIEQWKQAGHPITHKVLQRGTAGRAKATDVLQLTSPDGTTRRFLVQGVHDPIELGHFTSYYTEEREDLQ